MGTHTCISVDAGMCMYVHIQPYKAQAFSGELSCVVNVTYLQLQRNSSNQDTLGTRRMSSLEGCPHFRGQTVGNNDTLVLGDSNSVLLIKVPLFQGVLLRGVQWLLCNLP